MKKPGQIQQKLAKDNFLYEYLNRFRYFLNYFMI